MTFKCNVTGFAIRKNTCCRFPLEHFTQLYGIISSSAGLVGMVQYALFEWYESYSGSPMHVSQPLIFSRARIRLSTHSINFSEHIDMI